MEKKARDSLIKNNFLVTLADGDTDGGTIAKCVDRFFTYLHHN